MHIQKNQDILVQYRQLLPRKSRAHLNMDIKKTNKPHWSQLSCFTVLFTAQTLNYSQKASKRQSTPHFSKMTDNCSPESFAVTLQAVVTLLLQSPQRPAKVFLYQLLCFKPSPVAWGRLRCQRPCGQLWAFPVSWPPWGIFSSQVLTFLFSALDTCF